MKCVVTGGAGYIGSVTSSLLLEAGHHVLVLDNLTTGHADAIPDGCAFIELDIRETARVAEALHGADAVLHFAAKSIVPQSVIDPDGYWDNNVHGSQSLLAAIREANVPRLVFSSTAAVYGNPATVPIPETAPTRPTNPYGETKLAIDMAIAEQAATTALAAMSLRYFNVAGATSALGERHDPETHLIPVILNNLASGSSEPVEVFGTDWDTPDGTCIRDYIHVIDLARAHLLALDAVTTGTHQVVNLGSGSGFSVLEVLAATTQATGIEVPWRAAPRRSGDPERLIAAVDTAREVLGWKASLPLVEMIADAWHFRNVHHGA